MSKQAIVNYITTELESYSDPNSITPSILANIIATACTMVYRPADVFCSSSGIEVLDLSEYDNLERLYGANNPFTNLNISACVDLKVLNVRGSEMPVLNLSTNVLLEDLDVSGNGNLTTLTLPANNNLKSLNIRNTNNLAPISIAPYTNLVSFIVHNKDYSNVDWTGNSSLPATLKHFEVENCMLDSALNLTNKTNLEYLFIRNNNDLSSINLTGVTNLKEVDIQNTVITSLNLSGNTNLKYLGGNTSLTTLNLHNTGLEDFQISCPLSASLVTTGMTQLKSVYLNGLDVATISFPNSTLLENVSLIGNIGTFDASIYPALTNLALESDTLTSVTLPAGNNIFTHLTIRNYPGSSLDLTIYPNMTNFDLAENTNPAMDLDISGMTNLTRVYLGNVSLDTFDASGSNVNEFSLNPSGTITNAIFDDVPFLDFSETSYKEAYKNLRARNLDTLTSSINVWNPGLISLDLNNLTFQGSALSRNRDITINSSASFTTLSATNSNTEQLSLTNCNYVTTVNMSNSSDLTMLGIDGASTWAMNSINFNGCAIDLANLTQFMEYLAGGSTSNGTLNLAGGTNAALDATCLGHKATLEGRGWTVTHN